MQKQVNTMLVDKAMVYAAKACVERLMTGVVYNSPVLFTIEDIFVRLADGRMQLWLFYEEGEEPHMFAITLVESFPRGSIAHIMLAAGKDFRQMRNFAPSFEVWAKTTGADYIHFDCSPKMATIMKRYGYAPTAMAVYKSLHVAH